MDTKSQGAEKSKRVAPGLAEITLTKEAAEELTRRLESPSATPTRPPTDLPTGDPSLLRQKAR
jgi:hypothetical protein